MRTAVGRLTSTRVASERPDLVLTRREAAAFLQIGVRTLDRLGIRKSYVGRRVFYQLADLQAYLDLNAT